MVKSIIPCKVWINTSVKYYEELGIMEVYKMDKNILVDEGGGIRGQSKKDEDTKRKYQRQSAIRAGTRIRELVLANGLRYLWTLTYRDEVTDRCQVAKDFTLFVMRLSYALGEKVHYVAVIEVQEKRAAKTGKDILHMHMAVNGYIEKEVMERTWGHGYTFVSKHSEDILRVAGYMSKYVKKGFEDERVRVKEKKRYFNSKGLIRPERQALYMSDEEVREIERVADKIIEYEGARWIQVKREDEEGVKHLISYFKELGERSWRSMIEKVNNI